MGPEAVRTGAFVAALDYVLPGRRVHNEEVAAAHPGWQMDQVVQRTGVVSRCWCDPHETALDLGERACRKLFARAGCDVAQIDVLLFCTQTPDYIMPPNACLLQHRLGLGRNVAALDYSLACSGFIYGLFLADSLVRSGAAKNVLLVTAETYSKLSHPDDRGTRTLFGDGAAATLISAGKPGLSHFLLGTDGGSATAFYVPAGGARTVRSAMTARAAADQHGNIRSAEQICMNGAAVMDFVKKEIPTLVGNILKESGLTMEDLDLVVFHQASKLTLDYLNAALRIPEAKRYSNIAHIGNTVSPSLPIALRQAETAGRLRRGMQVLLAAFGVGLSWGGCILRWNPERS